MCGTGVTALLYEKHCACLPSFDCLVFSAPKQTGVCGGGRGGGGVVHDVPLCPIRCRYNIGQLDVYIPQTNAPSFFLPTPQLCEIVTEEMEHHVLVCNEQATTHRKRVYVLRTVRSRCRIGLNAKDQGCVCASNRCAPRFVIIRCLRVRVEVHRVPTCLPDRRHQVIPYGGRIVKVGCLL